MTFSNSDVDGKDIAPSSVSTDDIHTKTIGAADYHYAGGYDGADPDGRLDAALTDATNGDLIYLEATAYTSAKTIEENIWLAGAGYRADNGTTIQADWTHEGDESGIERVNLITNTLTVTGNSFCATKIRRGTIEFQSNTSDGIVDTCSLTSVTDNGTNTVGDIS